MTSNQQNRKVFILVFALEHMVIRKMAGERLEDTNESLFVKFFGGTPLVKTIDFLLENHLFDYTKKEIAEGAGISQSTLEKFWSQVEESAIIVKTRKIDKAQLYATNAESPIIKELSRVDLVISDQYADQILQAQKVPA